MRAVLSDLTDTSIQPAIDRRSVVVLLSVPTLLTVFQYYGQPRFFERLVEGGMFEAVDLPLTTLAYLYWVGFVVVAWLFLPLLLLLFIRESPRDFGLRWRGVGRTMGVTAIALVPAAALLYWTSGLAPLQASHPAYGIRGVEAAPLGLMVGCILVYTLTVEWFFRGFLLLGLRPKLGNHALMVMVVPYTMIHFDQPLENASLAMLTGLGLGWLALKTRSILPGALIHFAVLVGLEVMVRSRLGV